MTVGDNFFNPTTRTVPVGTTVRWNSTTSTPHTITPQGHSQWNRVAHSTVGEVLAVTFTSVGSFPYQCELHPMSGTIVVTAQ